jgi:drug/metabolite transporter (DMT)-like permease
MGLWDVLELTLLAMIWGGSFLCYRIAAPEFGPMALVALRVGIAALLLGPVLLLKGRLAELRGRGRDMFAVGAINSALPFCLLAYATLSLTAGFTSILNATSPLWGGLVAHFWLRDHLTRSRAAGLFVGFAGVLILFWDRASFTHGGAGLAALAATLSYGVGANMAKRRLGDVEPLAVAAGSQVAATILLAPLAVASWPGHSIAPRAWVAAVILGVICTAAAFVLYFRLIAHVGPTKAIAVTFLIPAFAVAWGGIFLREPVTARMLVGSAVILCGTALATGLAKFPGKRRASKIPGARSEPSPRSS